MTPTVGCTAGAVRCTIIVEQGEHEHRALVTHHQRTMRPFRHLLLQVTLTLALSPASAPRAYGQSAGALLDTALTRMGGVAAAREVRRVRFEMMTQWQRTAFDTRPYADQPSYESHSDLRDYESVAWRNSRRFNNGRSVVELVDVVRDSVAIRRSPSK